MAALNDAQPQQPIQPSTQPVGGRRSWLVTALVWGVALLFLIPFLWMISSSLKPNYQIFETPPRWIPNPPAWGNYREALTILPFDRYVLNTAIISLLTILGHLLSCTLIAYAFARLRAPGRNALFVVVLATMMLPYPVTMTPLYVLFNRLGWINTFLPLIVPSYFGGGAFFIFLLRQFFATIPRDLDEAAKLDGASSFRIFWNIILPLSGAALATVAIFSFLQHWNEFIGPLIFLNTEDKFTLSIGLRYFIDNPFESDEPREAILMAASLIVALPSLILFFMAQKYFVRGIATTGLKG